MLEKRNPKSRGNPPKPQTNMLCLGFVHGFSGLRKTSTMGFSNTGPRRRFLAAHGLQWPSAPLQAAAVGARAWRWRGQVRHRLSIGQSTG